jgi:MFS family permease
MLLSCIFYYPDSHVWPSGFLWRIYETITDEFGGQAWSRCFFRFFSNHRFASILTGWLNDRLGPRTVLTICGLLAGAGLMLMFLVDSAWQLYLFYVVLVGPVWAASFRLKCPPLPDGLPKEEI